ncbi:MlaE family ABC transporter permease [Sandaracinus amylolyticus]|uniref:MlaE family ABC transporter permease n=1 Tax=Sandaracinus amylolyticus TaxID=927083 RepID=UPI001F17FD0B|nr:ABC transporter permease [Sandaracinus amylolyticus]UJR80324.1 ABC-type transport system involved in resistance to organic solvent, permease component [Sandaracinus amylolyticus]
MSALETMGAPVLHLVREIRDLFAMLARTVVLSIRGRRDRRTIVEQAYQMGNRSVFFVSVTMGFIGTIMVFQAGLQALKIVPELSMLGATFAELLVRDLAASIGAMMLATRVGAGIAAEIGSMVVTEQVDAMRMCAADPIEYLVVPRFLASVLMTFCLLIWAAVVAFGAGMVTANVVFEVNYATFANFSMVDAGDVIVGLTKMLAYGAAIPIVSARCGLTTFGGSEGVGWATTNAVVQSSLAVIVLNFVISSVGFLLFPG